MDLLKQETEHGALNVPHLSNYILNLMALLCAPVRDEAVQKLENIKDPVELLRQESSHAVLICFLVLITWYHSMGKL